MNNLNTIVIDNGTCSIKYGFAGDDVPKSFIQNYVGFPKQKKAMVGASPNEYFVGKDAEKNKGILYLKHPMRNGIIDDWNNMERIWQHMYENELEVSKEDYSVLITECPMNPLKNKEQMAQTFFENFSVPSLFVSIPSILSLYASSATTGAVLDSGDGLSYVVPVFNGFSISNSIKRIDVGGRDITEYFQTLLRKSGYIFHTSSELEIVRKIKESVCTVSRERNSYELNSTSKESLGTKEFKLPDGQIVEIDSKIRSEAPEILFDPSIIGMEYMGVHECLLSSIKSCDLDVRETLFSSVFVSGGSTLFDGFCDRLIREIRKNAPKGVRIKMHAPPERAYSSWIGGSILASLGVFSNMSVSLKEYEENGFNIFLKKTF